ncbi:MAG TPA: ABC transporter substrate-binding protein [Trueperaceae bacterium]|nr:ABC transporter substrate-binding protein [Trueperaceae bacterium]
MGSIGTASPRRARLGRALAALLAAALLGVAAAQTVVTVGFSLPLTGGAAKEGTEAQVGAELAAQVIDDAGGFQVGDQTVTFRVIFEDDQCNPQAGVEAANRLVVAGAQFAGGSFCSSAALSQMPVFAALGVPQIPFAYADDLTGAAREDSGARLSARIGPNALLEMAPLAKYAVLENGHTTFFAMGQNTDFGRSMVESFRAVAESLGGSFVAEPEYFPFANADFRTLLTRARDSGADAIVAIGLAQEMIGIVLQHDELGLTQTIYGSDLMADVSVQEAVGALAQNTFSPWYYDAGEEQRTFERQGTEPGATALREAAEQHLGIRASRNHALGWGTIMLLKQAMERAGTTDPEAVMAEVLSGDTFEMPYGDYGWLQCGQADIRVGVAAFDDNGRLLVADRDYAEADPAVISRDDLCR